MQEKIGQIINDWYLKASRTIYWQENAAAEIATLFERKVIWCGKEGIATKQEGGRFYIEGPDFPSEYGWELYMPIGAVSEDKLKDGQRVRVIVEEIDE